MSEEQEGDFIEESLVLAPEPYKTIIRKRLDDGVFARHLEEMQERYALTEDQIDIVTLIVFRAACDPDCVDSLKDTLIAEADVSYEVAVKIQRDITQDVILPIKEEGDTIIDLEEGDSMSRAEPGFAGPGAGEALFSDNKARVTLRTVDIGGATHPVGALVRIVGPYLVGHLGFIGDLFLWGDWYVSVHFVDGEERNVYWKDQDVADNFAKAIRDVMA